MDCKLIKNKLTNQIPLKNDEQVHLKQCENCQIHLEATLQNDDITQVLDHVFKGYQVDEQLNKRIQTQLYGGAKRRLSMLLIAAILMIFGTVYATGIYTYLPMFSKANETQTDQQLNSSEQLIQNDDYRLIVKDIVIDQRSITMAATVLDKDNLYPRGKTMVFSMATAGADSDYVVVTNINPNRPWGLIEFELPLDYRLKDSVTFNVDLMDNQNSLLSGSFEVDVEAIKDFTFNDFSIDKVMQADDLQINLNYARLTSTYLKVDLDCKALDQRIIEMAEFDATFTDNSGKPHMLTSTYMRSSAPDHYELVFRFDKPITNVQEGVLTIDGVAVSYMHHVTQMPFDYKGHSFNLTHSQPRQSSQFADIQVVDYQLSTQDKLSASEFPELVIEDGRNRDRLYAEAYSIKTFTLTEVMIKNIESQYGISISDEQVFSDKAIEYLSQKYDVKLVKASLDEQIKRYNQTQSSNEKPTLNIALAQDSIELMNYVESTVISPDNIYIIQSEQQHTSLEQMIELK